MQPTNVAEIQQPHEAPEAFVRRLAQEKAAPISVTEADVVLGADTVVSIDGRVYGKPVDREEATAMLRSLSGRSHWVHTGICLRSRQRSIEDVARTEVFFLPLSEQEIQEYTRSGEYEDKAGAYAIQGQASRFVEKIHGCYFNVVGLPVSLVYRYLRELEHLDNSTSATCIP